MKKKIVEALYLGERISTTGNIVQDFRLKTGEVINFKSIKWVYPGGSYIVYKSKEGHHIDTKAKLIEEPTLKRSEEEERRYAVYKEACRQYRIERRKLAYSKQMHPDIQKAINLLRPFSNSVDYVTLRRFTDMIHNELSKKPRRK
jgi:hypothetical protein